MHSALCGCMALLAPTGRDLAHTTHYPFIGIFFSSMCVCVCVHARAHAYGTKFFKLHPQNYFLDQITALRYLAPIPNVMQATMALNTWDCLICLQYSQNLESQNLHPFLGCPRPLRVFKDVLHLEVLL